MPETYDYVIVGAGSAGCVVASRLSEDPSTRVLLIEAGGKDRSPNIKIPVAFPNQFHTKLDWDFMTEPEPHADDRRLYIARGKSLGGSSSMNAMLYVRGRPLDYDGWAAEGAQCHGPGSGTRGRPRGRRAPWPYPRRRRARARRARGRSVRRNDRLRPVAAAVRNRAGGRAEAGWRVGPPRPSGCRSQPPGPPVRDDPVGGQRSANALRSRQAGAAGRMAPAPQRTADLDRRRGCRVRPHARGAACSRHPVPHGGGLLRRPRRGGVRRALHRDRARARLSAGPRSDLARLLGPG